MARARLPIKDWQDRLIANFSHDGVVGGSLLTIAEIEDRAGGSFVETYHGHHVLSDSFMHFFLETLRSVDREMLRQGATRNQLYPHVFAEFVMAFRRTRAATLLSIKGYPGAALASLRDIKDRSIQLAALFTGRTTYSELQGIPKDQKALVASKEGDIERRKARILLERQLNDECYGKASGLAPDVVTALGNWSDMFNLETHGSHLSYASSAYEWLIGKAPLGIVKVGDDLMEAMYMNRFNEVSWMMHRLLPFLQIENGFGEGWVGKWWVLDESIWQVQLALSEDNKKTIGNAFIAFVDAKFPFEPKVRFF